MSVKATTWAWAQQLAPGPKFTLVALADHANAEGECYPGQKRLSAWTGYTPKAIRRHLEVLEAAGLIERGRRHRKDGSRTSDHYRLIGYLRDTASPRLADDSPPNLGDVMSPRGVTTGNEVAQDPHTEHSDPTPTGRFGQTYGTFCPNLGDTVSPHELSVDPSEDPSASSQDLKPSSFGENGTNGEPTPTRLSPRVVDDEGMEKGDEPPKAKGKRKPAAGPLPTAVTDYLARHAPELPAPMTNGSPQPTPPPAATAAKPKPTPRPPRARGDFAKPLPPEEIERLNASAAKRAELHADAARPEVDA